MDSIVHTEFISTVIAHILFMVHAEVMNRVVNFEFLFFQLSAIRFNQSEALPRSGSSALVTQKDNSVLERQQCTRKTTVY